MPSRNRVKIYGEDVYYHIYNRGVNKARIYYDAEDYAVFLNLLRRYLDADPTKDKKGREYTSLYGQLELLAYCLMPNHFHMLIYQIDREAMTKLMRGVATSYSAYFNKKYHRKGPLFQERFKASMITSDGYLEHISRYIHLNPIDIRSPDSSYLDYAYSSIGFYLGKQAASWVRPERILSSKDRHKYRKFLQDYEDVHRSLDAIKRELAGY